MADLSEREWQRLIETVRRGNCVLVLGSGVVVDPADSKQRPLTSRLASELAGRLGDETQFPDKGDQAIVAQLCLEQRDYDRIDLEIDVATFYEPFADQTTELHRNLAALPFHLCLTTTPDSFLYNAFSEAGLDKSPVRAFYNIAKPGYRTQLPAASAKTPIIFSLFGDLGTKESLVLTETELLDFLIKVITPSSGLPPDIAGRIADPQTSFLFVGFGFERWYTRILLHVLKTQRHRSRSLALEGAAFFEHPDHRPAAVFFEHEHSIVIRRHSWPEFAEELRQRHDRVESEARGQGDAELPAGAPKVFLCHDSRDRDLVTHLESRFHPLGVDTWRDRQELRGGEDWDRRIGQVISKQVDYVLVLETPNMVGRVESYLFNEIHEALARQKRFRGGERFVIPAALEPCDGLEELDHLNRGDLTSEAGVVRLAQEILEDWRGRQGLNAARPQ